MYILMYTFFPVLIVYSWLYTLRLLIVVMEGGGHMWCWGSSSSWLHRRYKGMRDPLYLQLCLLLLWSHFLCLCFFTLYLSKKKCSHLFYRFFCILFRAPRGNFFFYHVPWLIYLIISCAVDGDLITLVFVYGEIPSYMVYVCPSGGA